jgi:hypothetical protein
MRGMRLDVRTSLGRHTGGASTPVTSMGRGAGIVDQKLEVVIIAVTDVDRAKDFYRTPALRRTLARHRAYQGRRRSRIRSWAGSRPGGAG